MKKIDFYRVTLFVILSQSCNGYRILGIFPHLGASHFRFFHPIMKRLAEVGHQVTVISHFPEKNPHPNYKDLSITGEPELSVNLEVKVTQIPFLPSYNMYIFVQNFSDERPFYADVETLLMVHDWAINACKIALKSSAIQTVLEARESYDLIVMEQFNSDCMMGIAWKLQLPVVALSSCSLIPWHFERFGSPQLPSYIPSQLTAYTEKMTYFQRINNWISAFLVTQMYK